MALLGNSIIIYVVQRHPKLRTTFNMLIVNMAASDILDVITAVPLSVAYLFVSVKWFPGGFGVFLCKLLPFLAYLSMGASVLTLTVMTIDRYFAIVRPMRRPLSKQLTMVAIILTWLISGAIFATELYKFRLFNDSGQVICAPRWVENIQDSHKITMFEKVIRFVLLYLVPLLTMAMFYSKIVLHLWKRKAPGVHIDKNQKRIEKQKRKVVTMLVTIVTLFAICWLPAHVNHFLLIFNLKVHSCLPPSLILTFYFLTHSNAAINPCLYLVFNESFREGFKHQVYNRLSRGNFNGSERLSTTRAEAFSATTSYNSLLSTKHGSRRDFGSAACQTML